MNHSSDFSPIQATTMGDLLRHRARRQPDRRAYTFLVDGETEEAHLTHSRLDQQARAIAAHLQQLDMAGKPVLLLLPPGLPYIAAFFGCLYAGAVAIPAYSPPLNRPDARLSSIIKDSQVTVAITRPKVIEKLKPRLQHLPELAGLQLLATDEFDLDRAALWQAPALDGDTLAFLQYTSGATANPKGLMVSHGNLLANAAMIQRGFEETPQGSGVFWLPPYHDMGLVGAILQPLYVGGPSILMPPAAFLQHPYRWLQAITRYRATSSGGPNFAYDLCVHRITPAQRETLDLNSWAIAFVGAEPIRPETLERFAATFETCGFRREAFYPCYGLAEATLWVTGGQKAAPPILGRIDRSMLEQNRVRPANGPDNSKTVVGCGQAQPEQKIVVVSPETATRCPAGQIGEIWVSGPNVAQGYWNRPEETDQTFKAYLADTGAGPFLRTGDLGFMEDGQLFLTGRLKDLIIIRGQNFYPQDIELTAEQSHPALAPRTGAAFSVEVAQEERLVIAQEIARSALRSIDPDEVIAAIRKAVSESHQLQVYAVVLLKPGATPRTSSGKIQRQTCRRAFLQNSLSVVKQWQQPFAGPDGPPAADVADTGELSPSPAKSAAEIQAWLKTKVARWLDVDPAEVDVKKPFSEYGLDSMVAVSISGEMELWLERRLSPTLIFDYPTIDRLASHLAGQSLPQTASEGPPPADSTDQAARIESAEQIEPHQNRASRVSLPLTKAQQHLWVLAQLGQGAMLAGNPSVCVELRGPLNLPALRQAAQQIVDRHQALRTTISPEGDGQWIWPLLPLHVPVHDFSHLAEEARQKEVEAWFKQENHRPFDLSQGPLLRVQLLKLKPQHHLLTLTGHHIVTDGWSFGVILQELSHFYSAACRNIPYQPEPPVQFSQFIRRQIEQVHTETRAERYWLQQFSDDIPQLNLPLDHPYPPLKTFRANRHTIQLETGLTTNLKQFSRRHNCTLFMALLAVYGLLLHRLTHQSDLVIGIPASLRSFEGGQGMVGYGVNLLPIRSRVSGKSTFTDYLAALKSTLLDAFKHRHYPFETLVEQLQLPRNPGQTPLVSVIFNQERTVTAPPLLDLEARWGSPPIDFTKFDIRLDVTEIDGRLILDWDTNADILEPATIERWSRHYLTLVQAIVADPHQSLADLPLLTPAERERLLVEWNRTGADYDYNRSIHRLFEAQAARTPTAVAVIFEGEELTYHQLDCRANQLAHYLQGQGVGPDTLVGLGVERSLEMIVGLLGILKAGGAFVPLDPHLPRARLAFMLDDTQLPLLLTQHHLLAKLPPTGSQIFCLDSQWKIVAQSPQDRPRGAARPDNLAYVIYTSGSTGLPKGVMLAHRGISNRLLWMQQTFQLTGEDRVLHKAPLGFDASVWEIFLPLLAGATLVVARPGGQLDLAYLIDLINQHQISTLHFVPSMLRVFLAQKGVEQCRSIRRVWCGGEVLSPELQDRFFACFTADLYNGYGPTEASINATYWLCRPEQNQRPNIPIGRPIANNQIYLLDDHLQPVPIGVPGELHIGGVGLARGYLNRPELTAEKFIPNPFSASTPAQGERLYKTGDLARYRPDGTIEFLGRLDRQVQIRGIRIELGEIETVLAEHPAVRETAVRVYESESNPNLVAYVILNEKDVTDRRLRLYLKQKLPDYMAPAVFVRLNKMPLSPQGKLDYQALPPPDEADFEREIPFTAPRTPTEATLATLWAEVLELDRVSVHDDFFDLGGHSLLATRLLSRIRHTFQLELPLKALFERHTIAELAELIVATQLEPVPDEALAQVLAEVAELSDDEAQQHLSTFEADYE